MDKSWSLWEKFDCLTTINIIQFATLTVLDTIKFAAFHKF